MKSYFMSASAMALLLLAPACSTEGGDAESADATAAADGETAAGAEGSSEDLSIAENLAAMPELSTFNDAVAAAGLTETLGGVGPYTVFAPTNSAFDAVDGAGDMIDAGGPELVNLISYHIVPGVVTSEDLRAAIELGDGSVEIATMTGALLTGSADGDDIVLTDGAGNAFRISGADNAQQNGMVHVIDGVAQAQ